MNQINFINTNKTERIFVSLLNLIFKLQVINAKKIYLCMINELTKKIDVYK